MKKSNYLLAISSFIAALLYIMFDKFSFSFDALNVNRVFFVGAQVLFFFVLFFCFTLKNRTVLLFLILVFAGIVIMVAKQEFFTYFPLLLSIWFVRTVEEKPKYISILPYIISMLLSIVTGAYLLMVADKSDAFSTEFSLLHIVVYVTLAVVFLMQCLLTSLQKKKKAEKQDNKKWRKRLDNFKVTFYFLESFILVESVAFFINSPPTETMPVAFALIKVFSFVYCSLKLYELAGNEIKFLNKLKALW